MNPNIRIVTWNANGLTEKRQEFEVFLSVHKIDVALISETRFTSKSYLNIKNYTVYLTNHPSGNSHGGTAIIIKNNIKHYPLEPYSTEKIQGTSVKIFDNNSEIALSAIYCPPRHSITAAEFATYFSNLGNKFISGGDWNAKHTFWGSRLISPRGRQLLGACNTLGLDTFSDGKPTHWPTDLSKTPDLLDFYVTKNLAPVRIMVSTLADLSSDHSPVELTLNTKIDFVDSLTRCYNKNTNWNNFRRAFKSKIAVTRTLNDGEKIEEAIENFNQSTHQSLFENTRPQKTSTQKFNAYPRFIKEKILEKRKYRKIWQRTRYPSDKRILNKVTRELKEMINDVKNKSMQSYLTGLGATKECNYSLWKATNKFKRPIVQIPPIRNGNGGWARSDDEKASVFGEHLHAVFKPLPTLNNQHDLQVSNFLEAATQLCIPLKGVSYTEVKVEIKGLQKGKSPGYDQIDETILSNLPKKGIMAIKYILDACIKIEYFPSQWKIATVIMINKPGKPPTDPTSYRPISLLPIIGKILERLILKRMKSFLPNIIPDHQFGFREKHGTTEQIHRVSDKVWRSFENKQYCSAVFLDIAQAFDKVWHDGLLFKVKRFLPHSFYNIIKSYLENRCFEVRVKNSTSNLFEINSGVPQGSILGPVLYLIFTADIPSSPGVMTATYADDTAILAENVNPVVASDILQSHLNELQNWFDLWRIKINQTKSVHVTFTLRRNSCPPVYIYNTMVPQADEAKYLGMRFDRRLTWQKHIWMKRKQLDTKLRGLYWLIGKRSHLSDSNKILIYKSILKPVWTYGIQLWGTASNSNIEILERFQSKTIRNVLNIPQFISNKYIYADLKIKTVKQEVASFGKNYQIRLIHHPSALATRLGGDGSVVFERLKRNAVGGLTDRFSS